jgi:hypothetical protein
MHRRYAGAADGQSGMPVTCPGAVRAWSEFPLAPAAERLADRFGVGSEPGIEQDSPGDFLYFARAPVIGQFWRLPSLLKPPVPLADGYPPRRMHFRKFLKLAVDACRAGQGPAYQAGQVVGFELVLLRAHDPPDAVAGLGLVSASRTKPRRW